MSETLLWLGLVPAIAISLGWRVLGVALSGRVNVDGPVFAWIRCVAFALLAGLIARMMIFPEAVLDEVPLTHRIGPLAFGLAVFFLTRRSLLAGLAAGVGLFMVLASFFAT